ncbi:MAG: hypothetical protein FP816_14640 [Desulfobacteraceae bacterium]|nr:hypothetical protein [Desulfobacteraceae bacterium]MBU4054371.1 hypothetical protein [Pseudomonadota bacterium]
MNLFTIFHANLAFSSIPSEHYDWVLDHCYWPLLDFVEREKIKTGLEFSGQTLQILSKMDPSMVEAMVRLMEKGLLEPVCGAQFQSIGPLMPAEDNLFNYAKGRKTFHEILGKDAKILYIPEQTVSRGILDLVAKTGYDAVFVEWNNAVRFGSFDLEKKLLFHSPLLNSLNGEKLRLLWNHSVLFQKVQRYIFGEIQIEDVLTYLENETRNKDGLLCLYGSDLEIFGYFPGTTLQFDSSPSRQRWSRFIELVEAISKKHDFVLPSEGIEQNSIPETVTLGSAAFPILCKKQPKYNPVRWSVCGRGGYQLNRSCFMTSSQISILKNSRSISPCREKILRGQLAPCWASDYRTFTTEEKWFEANRDLHHAASEVEKEIENIRKHGQLGPDEILILSDSPSPCLMVEKELRFPPGAVLAGAKAYLKENHILKPVKVQWEDIHTYSNGYVRSARVVLLFDDPVPQVAKIQFKGHDPDTLAQPLAFEDFKQMFGKQVSFNLKRGLCLDSVVFQDISQVPLMGTIAHGFFDSIDWDADFYSGSAQIDTGNDFYHDLSPVESIVCFNGPLRTLVEGMIPMGPVSQKKKYAIYHGTNRLDVIQSFMVKQLNSVSFRAGIITLLPNAWNRDTLSVATLNGGEACEIYSLSGQRVSHSEPVKTGISSRSCLGATGGWTAFSDGEKTLTISRDLMKGHSAPLLRYEEIGEQFFARLYHSLGERDDTSLFSYRGLMEERFVITARRGEVFQKMEPNYMVLQQGG